MNEVGFHWEVFAFEGIFAGNVEVKLFQLKKGLVDMNVDVVG